MATKHVPTLVQSWPTPMHSFVRNKSNDASEDPRAQLSDPDKDNDIQQVEACPRDDSSVLCNESDMGTGPSNGKYCSPAAMNKRETTAAPSDTQSDSEHGSNIATNNGVNVAVLSLNEPDGHTGVNERRINASPSNAHSMIKINERENTAEGHQKGKAVAEAEADDNDDDSKGCNEEDKLEDGDKTMRKASRLSKEAILVVHEFGRRVQEEATEIGKQFGKHQKATRKKSIWNQHQAWFKTVLHPSKAVSLQTWKVKQAEHYHAHSHKDPKNMALWKKIQEHFDHAIATPNDLSS
ncbi:hypothetical protein BDR06DRAFT_971618 [Suillus hirtellus]|nr:hypothetical protein BDR06DRAFT_971618 [Suillus hirtellus]